MKQAEESLRRDLPPTGELLVQGGDARIALDPLGRNKYGCPPFPDPDLLALGSSTASGISAAAYAAADSLRDKLLRALTTESAPKVYADELGRIRSELLGLCGISDVEPVFTASGTDAHLLAARLSCRNEQALAIMVEAAESGSSVPAALSDGGRIEVATVPIRLVDGTPRPPTEIDAEFATQAKLAASQGQRILLVLTDVSKSGMVAPSPACALELHRDFPGQIDVLVDACQFRVSPATLQGYLAAGFMVALTGSKFVGGPPFSGALLIPAQTALMPSGQPGANFGLLLRWEAALEELRAFRSVPDAKIEVFLREFARAVQHRLRVDPAFEPLPVPALARPGLPGTAGWDGIQTIFPFLLLDTGTRRQLSPDRTRQIYQLLQLDLSRREEFELGSTAALRCQFGQPVHCGERHGAPASALRLSASARMVVEAGGGESAARQIIMNTMAALNKAAALASSGGG